MRILLFFTLFFTFISNIQAKSYFIVNKNTNEIVSKSVSFLNGIHQNHELLKIDDPNIESTKLEHLIYDPINKTIKLKTKSEIDSIELVKNTTRKLNSLIYLINSVNALEEIKKRLTNDETIEIIDQIISKYSQNINEILLELN